MKKHTILKLEYTSTQLANLWHKKSNTLMLDPTDIYITDLSAVKEIRIKNLNRQTFEYFKYFKSDRNVNGYVTGIWFTAEYKKPLKLLIILD